MMKKSIIGRISVTFLFCFFAIMSCKKSSSSSNNCSFGTDPGTAPSGSQVTYSASATGSTSIETIWYQGVAGLVVVPKPTLPWSISVPLPNGGQVALSTVGNATNGGIITLAWSINGQGGLQADTSACGH